MNKTLTVNIGGRVFNIEEHAFDQLNKYFNTIRQYFGSKESADEIISDIELRIAELFMERITAEKEVITPNDVEEVIEIMGRPEVFAADSGMDDQEEPIYRSTTGYKSSKRVFRDPDDQVLFGVCSGISAYLGWDPIILRIAFAVAFLTYGMGLLLYIVLAIIIPKAKTTAEKLQMRGEPVTVENISRKVSESFNDVKEDLKDFGKKNDLNEKRLYRESRRIGSVIQRAGQLIFNIVSLLVAAVSKVLGLVFILAAGLSIALFLSVVVGWNTSVRFPDGHMLYNEHFGLLVQSLFTDAFHEQLFLWSAGAIIAIPLIGLFLIGIRLFFSYKKIPVHVGTALTALFIAALISLSYSVSRLLHEFQTEAQYNEQVALPPIETDTLVVDLKDLHDAAWRFSTGFGTGGIFFQGNVTFPEVDSTKLMYMGTNRFTVVKQDSDQSFSLSLKRSARGSGYKDATQNAKHITTNHEVSGDTLYIPRNFSLHKDAMLRRQKAIYELAVPVGKRVYFTQGAGALLYDVPNVSNTLDADMVGHTWVMTQNGLTCESCNEVENKTAPKIPEEHGSY